MRMGGRGPGGASYILYTEARAGTVHAALLDDRKINSYSNIIQINDYFLTNYYIYYGIALLQYDPLTFF
uniref:Uncharacterized protein n=1 Tax=Pararge aegeria TaxID=116150 RepID=S4PS31_9NEOP